MVVMVMVMVGLMDNFGSDFGDTLMSSANEFMMNGFTASRVPDEASDLDLLNGWLAVKGECCGA